MASASLAPVEGRRPGLGKIANIFACGTALFSDGYANGIVGPVNTLLGKLYPVEYKSNNYSKLFSSLGFCGTVVGMLTFGYISDRVGRKSGMIIATLIVAVFAIASTGAYGAGGSTQGLLQALIAYRFLGQIGVGAEYPSGSVAASENTEDPGIPKGTQHRLFVLATNVAIDWGFVISAFIAYFWVAVLGESRLELAWRLSFAVGIIPPVAVLFWRFRMTEPARYQKEAIRSAPVPYWLIAKRYWRPFLGISVAWYIYDWIAYPFGIYSSTILDVVLGADAPLSTVFGWNVVINLFYIPGCMIGALLIDRVGPKKMIMLFLVLQAIVGFIMSGLYVQLSNQIGAFTVVYGLFLTFGEAGPGNCLGLLASKSFPTAIRGQAYGLAAAIGKIGAFSGSYTFPQIIAAFPAGPAQASGPFYIGSGLAIVSAIVIFLTIPELKADHMTNEDAAFRLYLEANGYDTTQMGLQESEKSGGAFENFFAPGPKEESITDVDLEKDSLRKVESDDAAAEKAQV